jgi:Predicted secreted protein (DUF2300)
MDGAVNGISSTYGSRPARRAGWHLRAVVARGAIACLSTSLSLCLCTGSAFAHEGVGPAICDHLPEPEAWLTLHAQRWDAVLSTEPGYERPAHVDVCRLDGRWPFADNHQDRVYVRRLQTTDDQVTLAHEYLHLAFKHFPSGHDERYVETTARRLVADYP